MKELSFLIKSLVFHGVVILVIGLSFFFKDDSIDVQPTPIEVSFVRDADVDKPSPKQPVEVAEAPPAKPKIDKPQPAPKAVETPKPRTDAKLAEKTQSKKVEPVKAPSRENLVAQKNITKPKPPEPKKVEPAKKDNIDTDKKAEEETQAEFTSVLKNLADTKPLVSDRDGPKLTQAPTVDRVTAGELDGFRKQLSGCWNLLPGAANAEALAVNLTITVNADRTVRSVEITDRERYNSDSFFRAAADNAIRAIRHPDCTPLDLPLNKYDQWKEITLNFDPNRMF